MKLFGQLIIIGGQVVGKIVASAYKQALASTLFSSFCILFHRYCILDAAKNPNISKESGASSFKGVMTVDEASKILNCSKNPSKEELVSVHL